MAAVKKVVRYLIAHRHREWLFRWQEDSVDLYCCSDSDWGGDKADRKSVSGGAVFLGDHLIRVWAKSQGAIALSSMEAELYAAVYGATETMGLANLLKDWKVSASISMALDSSAALGLLRREGLGRAKHIELHWLWLQGVRREGRVSLCKIDGKVNPADLFTKPLTGPEIEQHVMTLGVLPL